MYSNTYFKIEYYPHQFTKSVTIVLHKLNKDNYKKAKAYHQVALLNTLDKVLEAILAKCFSYLAIDYAFFSCMYMNRYKSTSIDNIYYHLLEQVYIA